MSDEFSESVKNLIKYDEAITSKLDRILYDVNEFHRKCKTAKTVGTSINVVSTVTTVTGICLAPFTAGLSFGLTVGGICSGVVGAATNITTDLCDHIFTKDFMNELKQLATDHDAERRKLQMIMEKIKEIIDMLIEKDGIDEDTAIITTVKAISLKIVNIGTKFQTAIAAREAIKVANILSTIKSTGTVFTYSVGNGIITESFKIASFGKPVADFTKAEMTGLAALLKNPKLASAGSVTGNLAKGAVGVLQVGFTVYEVVDLINSWNSDHPTVEKIVAFKGDLKKEITWLQSLIT